MGARPEHSFNRWSRRAAWSCALGALVLVLIPFLGAEGNAVSLPDSAKSPLLRGDWAQVLTALENSGMKDPDPVCRMVAAHACLATNRNNQALLLFLSLEDEDILDWKQWAEQLAKGNPGNASAQYLHADALTRCGELAAAEAEYTKAIQANSKLGRAWVGRGVLRAVQGRLDEAYPDLLQATQVEPGLADVHASLGCLEVMFQNAGEAEAAFNKALELDSTFALAYNGRGCARYGLGKPDEAFLDFEMAQTLCPAIACTHANQGFVLAMVANKVDQNIPAAERPGTTLTTRSQTLVIDIPGIRTQGEDRPDKWAPVLIGPQSYERFNLRHEGVRGLKDEPGQTILLPTHATPEIVQAKLKPLFDAQRSGKSLYVKIDQNIGAAKYFSPEGGREERSWAADLGDGITQHMRQSDPNLRIIGNAHSEGTLVAHQMDLKPYDAMILQSDRLDASHIEDLARQNRRTKFIVSSANMDFPHGTGRGYLSINEPNVDIVNLTGERNPLQAGKMHTLVHDSTTQGRYQVKFGTGAVQSLDGSLGNFVQNRLPTKYLDFATMTDDSIQAAVQKLGYQKFSQMVTEYKDGLLSENKHLLGEMKGQASSVSASAKTMIGLEIVKGFWRGTKLAGSFIAGGFPAFFAEGTFTVAKDVAGRALETTQPEPYRGVTKILLAGAKLKGGIDPVAPTLEGGQEAARVAMDRSMGKVTDLQGQIALNATRFEDAEKVRQRALTFDLSHDLGSQASSLTADSKSRSSSLTAYRFESAQPWSQMPKLLEDLTIGHPASGPVALVSQDPVKGFGFERMLNNRGISTLITPPLDRKQLSRLEATVMPSLLVGFSRELDAAYFLNDSIMRRAVPIWPDDHGGGGGAAVSRGPVIPVKIEGNKFSVPRGQGGTITLPVPTSFRIPAESWNSFESWTPKPKKEGPGGIMTDLSWTFVDKGDWPVMTFFTLAYEPLKTAARPEDKSD